MKRLILTLAAALTLGGAAAHAQPAGTRTVVTRTTVFHHNRDYHRGWNNNRGWDHHRGWSRSRRWHGHGRSCRTIWRHHTRTRICRSW